MSTSIVDTAPESAERLNRECFCITLDRAALCAALNEEAGDPGFCAHLIGTRPHLFSTAPVFLAVATMAAMQRTVGAIEAVTSLAGYRDAALAWAPEIARRSFGPRGVFMGYDFHLAADGLRLIEVNTNAGGAYLNAALAKAQRACCAEVETALRHAGADDFDAGVIRMFLAEWRLQRGTGAPSRVAIVDDRPEEQYLYPEFVLAQRCFIQHGIDAVIADASALRYEAGRLTVAGRSVDLVYNRLVDFPLDLPAHAALRAAYLDQAVVLTPSPRAHALFADKRNLTLLSDPALLGSWGASPPMLAGLEALPKTVRVTAGNAEELWVRRKALFFKPASGYGSKAVYRGDKLTKKVWAEILNHEYVAQALAAPSERAVEVDGARQLLKADVRLHVYDGQILQVAARLYRGQATNFRTPGGGFAPVFVV